MKLKYAALICFTLSTITPCMLTACKKENQAAPATTPGTPVSVAKVVSKKIDIQFASVGSITSQETPVVRAQTEGHVNKILVRIGDKVTKGQLLAELSEQDQKIAYNQAVANFTEAEVHYQEATLMAQRKGILAKRGIVSQLEYDGAISSQKVAKASFEAAKYSLESAKIQLGKTQVTSPIDGYVQSLNISDGDKVSQGTALLQLVNPELLRATLPFSEQKALYFSVGQAVQLTSIANPNQTLSTTVTNITPSINPKNRAVEVIIDFKNTQNWKPGSSVRGHVVAIPAQNTLVVPDSAVINGQQGPMVFVVKNKKAIATPIEAGYSQNGLVAVLSGLTEGELVVTDGANYLSNDQPVTITP